MVVACCNPLCWFFETLEFEVFIWACSDRDLKEHERKGVAERWHGDTTLVVGSFLSGLAEGRLRLEVDLEE